MKLGQASNGRNNNLNLLRFIAAIGVLYTHSWAITGHRGEYFLAQITNHQIYTGDIAVAAFFCFGGYLISMSMERIQKAGPYFIKRILRIFPPLIFVTFLMVFALGPIITELPLNEYFSARESRSYLLNSVLYIRHSLPGVFTNNPYNSTVNGSLWTLPIEFLCYIGCYIAYRLKLMRTKTAVWTAPIIVAVSVLLLLNVEDTEFFITILRPALMFYIGFLFYVYRDNIILSWKIAGICFLVIIVGTFFQVYSIVEYLCWPYVFLWLAFGTKRKFANFGWGIDISYGIYLIGWPIQQVICQLTNNSIGPIGNFFLTVLFSIIFGLIIYYLVEKPITKIQNKVKNKRAH